ncbi:hypothetical protein Tco_1304598 [Tanacetum coccineum]
MRTPSLHILPCHIAIIKNVNITLCESCTLHHIDTIYPEDVHMCQTLLYYYLSGHVLIIISSVHSVSARKQISPSRKCEVLLCADVVRPYNKCQGRKTCFAVGTTRTYTPGASGSNSGKQRIVTCYNYKGEGHMSKQCTKPKRKQDDTRFKDKVLLVQAHANGQILHEEELAFLADLGIAEGQAT